MNDRFKLLYVDDEPINLKLFTLNFKSKYDVITAESGFEALDILKKNSDTQIVISDMKMPGMSGIDFIRRAKEDYPSICFFILTGYDITPEITLALKECLIHKYFQKPFNMKEIECSINEALGCKL